MEVWSFLARGWWKINYDAIVVKDKAALAFVVRDDEGLLIMALTKLVLAQSMYEAKLKAIEWVTSFLIVGHGKIFVSLWMLWMW